jgi:hypothetical protein
MTAGEVQLLEWMLLVLGAMLVFSGWRTIVKRRTRTYLGEHEGKNASRLGWFWLILGLVLILAAVTDIAFLKTFGRLFLESDT